MTRKTFAFFAFLFLSALSLLLAGRCGREVQVTDEPTLAQVRSGGFAITVQSLGVLDAAQAHMISSTVKGANGKIIFLIHDGNRVKKGDLLVRLDPTPFEDEVSQLAGQVEGLKAAVDATEQLLAWEKNQAEQQVISAEFEIKVAELDLKRLRDGDGPLKLAQYQEEAEKAKVEYDRYKSYAKELKGLAGNGLDNVAEIERAQEGAASFQEKYEAAKRRLESYEKYVLPATLEEGKAKVENGRTGLEQMKKAGVFKVATAMAECDKNRAKLKSAEQALALARDELAKTEIRAPFDGIVIHYTTFRDGANRKPREGDTVLMNQPILYLPDISRFIVNTQVREIDLHKVSVGQPCTVRVDAYPDLLLKGKVSFIGALASEQGRGQAGGKYFQVTLDLEGQDPRLRPGMSTRVLIESEQVKEALTLPVQALFYEEEHTVCYRLGFGGYRRVVVTVGRQNGDLAEILSGLDQGDQISLIRPTAEQMAR